MLEDSIKFENNIFKHKRPAPNAKKYTPTFCVRKSYRYFMFIARSTYFISYWSWLDALHELH